MERGMALLSGGIDSPVAIHLLKDRLDIIAIHFHQEPLTDKKEVEKVRQLVRKLELKKAYLVPFTEVLKTLVEKCTHRNYFVLSKIMMLKAAEIVAEKEHAKYLITGENLAQVSSQTLSNLRTITKHVSLEIFRPVLAKNKQEIIDMAKEIGTYDISKGPEICNLLGPATPATKSDPQEIGEELEKLDIAALLDTALNKAEILIEKYVV